VDPKREAPPLRRRWTDPTALHDGKGYPELPGAESPQIYDVGRSTGPNLPVGWAATLARLAEETAVRLADTQVCASSGQRANQHADSRRWHLTKLGTKRPFPRLSPPVRRAAAWSDRQRADLPAI
jgi:hypothetical protein